MTGRVALLFVLGVSTILISSNQTRNTQDAVDNFVRYDNRSKALSIAQTGANLAAMALYFDNTASHLDDFDQAHWGAFRDGAAFDGGIMDVSVLRDGDQLRVLSKGTYPSSGTRRQRVECIYHLRPGYMDHHVMLTDNDPGLIHWTSYDTAAGNLHSNNTLFIDHFTSGVMPVFYGSVTSLNPVTITSGTTPAFMQGPPRSGVSIPIPGALPSTTEPVFDPIGPGPDWSQQYYINNGEALSSSRQMHLQFFLDGGGNQKVRVFNDVRLTNRGPNCQSPNGTGYYGDFRVGDTVMSPPASGILRTSGVDVFVEGTIKGKVTILAGSAGGAGGNIFLTDDVRCNTNPVSNPGSPDFIGLFAENNVVIGNTQTNTANAGTHVFTVHAAIIALNGGLTAADNQTRTRQRLEIRGSITQRFRKGVGLGSDPIGSFSGGFVKGYRYDSRFRRQHALLMPNSPLMVLEPVLVRTLPES